VVASHPHADHVIGLPAVLARYPVGVVLTPGCPDTSVFGAELGRAIEAEGVPIRHPRAGSSFVVGDMHVDVLSPDRCWTGTESDANNDALVIRISLGSDTILIATEPEEPAQEQLLDDGVDLRADVLKVPHHGAATSVPEFFQAVEAEIAVVSVGENDYGHPVPTVLEAIAQTGADVWRTDLHGDITVSFEGGSVTVESDR
jgi:competence protein ComEC